MSGLLSNGFTKAVISDYIESGLYMPGDRLPTVSELAAKYKVSCSTVRKALDVLEGRGLIVKRQGSGIYISDKASSSIEPQTGLIGFIGCANNDYKFMQINQGIGCVAVRKGYNTITSSSGFDYGAERSQVQRMVNAGCKAIIINPSYQRSKTQVEHDYLHTEFKDCPIILIDIAYPEQHRPMILFDNYHAGYDMASMLLSEGHKRIAFMHAVASEGHTYLRSNHERLRGYRDAMVDNGPGVNEEDIFELLFPSCWEDEQLIDWLLRWKSAEDKPTAVMSIEDDTAIRTISLAQGMGISVPDELCVIGFDNLPHGRIFHPAFHTTNPDFNKAGYIAAELAFEAIENGVETIAGRIYVLPVTVKRRKEHNLSLRIPAAIAEGVDRVSQNSTCGAKLGNVPV